MFYFPNWRWLAVLLAVAVLRVAPPGSADVIPPGLLDEPKPSAKEPVWICEHCGRVMGPTHQHLPRHCPACGVPIPMTTPLIREPDGTLRQPYSVQGDITLLVSLLVLGLLLGWLLRGLLGRGTAGSQPDRSAPPTSQQEGQP